MTSLKQNLTPIKMRNYGRILQDMVNYACAIEDESQRQALTMYIAQSMRQKNVVWNKEQDANLHRVKEDIARLSDGKLNCEFPEFEALMQRPLPQLNKMPQKKKNKK